MVCRNCGREIRPRDTLAGFEHVDSGFVLCCHTQAEPVEDTPVAL